MPERETPDNPTPTEALRATAAELDGDALGAEIMSLARRLSAGTYELLVLVGELDVRGTWAAWGAADAGKVCGVIDARVTRADAPAGASLRQQRADALVAVATTGGTRVATEVVIHVRPDGNALADGTPLSDHAVTALLPSSFVSLLMRDAANRPIDASPRRRAPTRRQERVVDERHPVCGHPGCTARAFLQHDHIRPHAAGGPTVVDNLQRLCGPHNRQRARSVR